MTGRSDTQTAGGARRDDGARRQTPVGVALVSTLPLLGLYLFLLRAGADDFRPLLVLALLLLLGLLGYAVLHSLPIRLRRLRARAERLLRDTAAAPDSGALPLSDLAAIEQALEALDADLARARQRAGLTDEDHKALLNAKLESLTTMARGVAHDFNNLLAAVLGNVSIILRNLPPDSSLRDNALQIESTALHAVELTNEIMTFSGRTNPRRDPLNLSGLVREMAGALEVSVAKGIELTYELAPDLPMIRGDRAQLTQVVTQLVVNASDAMTDRCGTIRLATGRLDCSPDDLAACFPNEDVRGGPYVYLDVGDTGCGIPAEVAERIFDPFFSTRIRGHGMGLPIVIGIVRAHEGVIKVTSSPQKGTVVRVLLPLNQAS